MDYEVTIKSYRPQQMAAIRAKTTLPQVPSKVVQLLNETSDYLQSVSVEPTGPGFAVYYEVGSFLVDLEVGYPVGQEVEGNDRGHAGKLPGGKAAVTLHKGPHPQMPAAHRAVQAWMREHEVDYVRQAREVFLSDLRELSESDECKTESVWPIDIETRADRRRKNRAS